MADMTIQEVRQLRDLLAAGIIELIQEFESDTGLMVRSIGIGRYTTGGAVSALSLETRLD